MPVKNKKALAKANSDAAKVVTILLGEYGIFARTTSDEKPMDNKILGDVVSDIGCIELQRSEKHTNFSLTADKITHFRGDKGDTNECFFLLECLREEGQIFAVIPFSLVEIEANKVGARTWTDGSKFYVFNPSSFSNNPVVVWSDTLEGVVRRFALSRKKYN